MWTNLTLAACLIAMDMGLCTLAFAEDAESRQPANSVAKRLTELFERLDTDHDGRIRPDDVASDQRRLLARLLRTADANQDQRLDRDEFVAGLTTHSPAKPVETLSENTIAGADALRLFLVWLDTNQDGRLSRPEVSEELEPIFRRLAKVADRDQNGELTRAELGRGGPKIGRTAMQIARQRGINVDRELAELGESRLQAVMELYERNGPIRILDFADDPEALQRVFARLDEDGDGQLSLKELPEGRRTAIRRMLVRIDRNQDGQLDLEEFTAAIGRLAELQQGRKPPRPAAKPSTSERPSAAANSADAKRNARQTQRRQRLRQLDSNRDGRLDRREVPPRIRNQFDRLDIDGDGFLKPGEVRRATAAAANIVGD